MMWNLLVSGLLVGATIVLYDGSPTHSSTDGLWQVAAEHGVTLFGAGAGYLLACAKEELEAGREVSARRAARGGIHRFTAARVRIPLGPGGPRPASSGDCR